MADSYARLINQNNFHWRAVFSAIFDKQDEDDQVLVELELSIFLNNNQFLIKSGFDKIDFRSHLEKQI